MNARYAYGKHEMSCSPLLSFWCCSRHRLMGKSMLEKPRCDLAGEELHETWPDYCEDVADISSVVFHRTDFDPSVVAMVT